MIQDFNIDTIDEESLRNELSKFNGILKIALIQIKQPRHLLSRLQY